MKGLRLLTLAAFCLVAGSLYAQDNSKDVELYKAKCAKCHGADGTATAGGKKLGAKDVYDAEAMKMTDAQWIETTTKGKGKMPAYGKSLSDDQIKGLIGYMRGLAKDHKK